MNEKQASFDKLKLACNHGSIIDIRVDYFNSNTNWVNRRDCNINHG